MYLPKTRWVGLTEDGDKVYEDERGTFGLLDYNNGIVERLPLVCTEEDRQRLRDESPKRN